MWSQREGSICLAIGSWGESCQSRGLARTDCGLLDLDDLRRLEGALRSRLTIERGLSSQMFEANHCPSANRARTAIGRAALSRPFKCAIADGLITNDTSIFDYGCGRGDDLRRLAEMGYQASGWDPVHRPDTPRTRSAVVNLGYVVNVIEDVSQRCEALRRAWALADQALIVSARLNVDGRALQESFSFADGCVTSRGTFQKFYEQHELRDWIDRTLAASAVPVAPGIFFVFRDEQVRSSFVATRYRRRSMAPRLARSAELFAAHKGLLSPLIRFVTDRGRLPVGDELAEASSIVEVFASLRRAFRVVLTVTDEERWEQIKWERRQDLLVYLALSHFEGRTTFGRLPLSLQRDVKAFFGAYKRACAEADELLFSIGRPGVLEAACRQSPVGKLTPSALYVHESVLPRLSPVLRLYEGCAQSYWGRIEGANIVKLHLDEPKVSYLSYPRFDRDPHPALAWSLRIHLQTFRGRTRDYRSSPNRPILHRKELFVSTDYPGREKFARLTRIEESKGLYDDTSRIGFEEGWNELLYRKGLYLKGHRLLVTSGLSSDPK